MSSDTPAPQASARRAKSILSPRWWAVTTVPLALLVIACAWMFVQVVKLSEAARWVKHTEESLAVCAEVERGIHEERGSVLEQIITRQIDGSTPSAARDVRDAFKRLREHISDNEAQLHQLAEARAAYATWANAVRHLADLDINHVDFNTSLEASSSLLEEALSSLAEVKREERRLLSVRSRALAEVNTVTVYGALPLVLLLALGVGFNSRKQVLRLEKSFSDALEGQLRAQRQVENQSWTREQLAAIIAATREEEGMELLGRRILRELAESTQAALGTFYGLVDGQLELHAHMGTSVAPPRRVALDSGMLGMAATKTDYKHVAGLPAEYLRVASSTGSAPSGQVAFIPCHHNGEVLGIIELGFVSSIDSRVTMLLSQAGGPIGIAIAMAQKRARLRTYLSESRRQAEALQRQQEDVRNANEELSTQSEALKLAHSQLEERTEELEIINGALIRQRDELSAVKDELERGAVELQRANRYKSEFLASMSHELRTPLNSALILSKALAENKEGNLTPEQVKFAQTIHAGGQELLALISDVLDLSKIEAGALSLVRANATLEEILRPVVRITEPLARDRGLELEFEIHDPGESMFTDATRVQQILKNLLSNACKFTQSGDIKLTTARIDDQVTFAVRDTGIGIPQEELEAIFEAFHQAEQKPNRRFGGTGLGLSISRDLARSLGGDIAVESTLGSGSCFTLTIPLIAPESPTAAVTQLSTEPQQPSRSSSVPPPPSAEPEPGPPTLLIVWEDRSFAVTLAEVARSVDFESLIANSVEQGLQLAGAEHPSAIVLDADLEDSCGVPALDRFQSHPTTEMTPIHVLVRSESREAAKRISRNENSSIGYLQKPVEIDLLRDSLRNLLDRTRSPNRVLVVERDTPSDQSLREVLSMREMEVTTVNSIDDALSALRTTSFICVIVDLPGEQTASLLRAIADDDTYSFPKVIVYSSDTLKMDQEQELRRYSDAIIVESPRSPERLVDEVRMFLRQVDSTIDKPRVSGPPPGHSQANSTLRGKHVLLVEDDVRNIFALSSALERQGLSITVARNGREALEVLSDSPAVDMILMDLMMPEMDGLEATKRIRELQPPVSKTPIIALTARAMQHDQHECVAAGANDYVSKPIDVDRLVSLMRVWMPR